MKFDLFSNTFGENFSFRKENQLICGRSHISSGNKFLSDKGFVEQLKVTSEDYFRKNSRKFPSCKLLIHNKLFRNNVLGTESIVNLIELLSV